MSEKIGTTKPVISLLDAFSPDVIYTLSFDIASYVFFLSIGIIIIASKIRIIQNMMESIDNGGNTEKMIADILGYTALLVAYFIIIGLVIMAINVVTTFADSIGSFESVTDRMEGIFKAAKLNNSDDGWLMSLGVGITEMVGWTFFYASLLTLVAVVLVMRFAQGMVLGISFVWGLIAIPLSIISGYKPLKGWVQWLLIGAFWPFVEAMIMIFISGAFFGSAILVVKTGSSFAATDLYFMFTAINILLLTTVIASPFITNSLVKGDGSIASTVMPFATAAASIASGATSKFIDGSKKGSSLLGNRISSIGKSGINSGVNKANNYFTKINRAKRINRIRENRNQQPSNTPNTKSNNNNSKNNKDAASTASGSSRVRVKRTPAQIKQRKGVFINKKNKPGSSKGKKR